jgi:hypothetical protein
MNLPAWKQLNILKLRQAVRRVKNDELFKLEQLEKKKKWKDLLIIIYSIPRV